MVESMDSHHAGSSEDEYLNLDAKAFTRMIEKNIGLGEPTEIEDCVLSETVSHRQLADTAAARQASQTIYAIFLPKKIQEVKDEEIFQNFRPPTAGLDDPLLTAPAQSYGPFSTLSTQAGFRKTSVGRALSVPRDTTATLLWGNK
ncbi:hypothetical protein RSOL_490590 [Rhizoctonia solani AG-3 Rhs1AP]|uniref:Uncharacterized protein n=2 Tax=Rhizoctonia solani AG-3 TaxID=1086053 RepID=A0A074RP56_9AGAM|nr:hypothetical protein RSOL_490590 [Rhizoctonia solani AG-3 Rhs1AP]KEP48654.1 hypothetical protein V565_119240 [Rhizoctonia solani 123E]